MLRPLILFRSEKLCMFGCFGTGIAGASFAMQEFFHLAFQVVQLLDGSDGADPERVNVLADLVVQNLKLVGHIPPLVVVLGIGVLFIGQPLLWKKTHLSSRFHVLWGPQMVAQCPSVLERVITCRSQSPSENLTSACSPFFEILIKIVVFLCVFLCV